MPPKFFCVNRRGDNIREPRRAWSKINYDGLYNYSRPFQSAVYRLRERSERPGADGVHSGPRSVDRYSCHIWRHVSRCFQRNAAVFHQLHIHCPVYKRDLPLPRESALHLVSFSCMYVWENGDVEDAKIMITFDRKQSEMVITAHSGCVYTIT